jgi:hypothetical protein
MIDSISALLLTHSKVGQLLEKVFGKEHTNQKKQHQQMSEDTKTVEGRKLGSYRDGGEGN